MAKVSLRAYNREIEAMIDRGHLDEAVAHCQHILKTFPKHLETYRLLGKAYLEARRHGDAIDIFSRVLTAEPNDFVAHVGMSIIRDEQGKLDDAIWHMERAYEVQSANPAIQGELQRLYGRRDGIQPPRIRMTRGALAHMYMRGELYPQAISETKGVLEGDQGRIDMLVLCAKAYYRSGQKNDAADAASSVLKRYPYCLDANLVLAEILSNDRPESAQVYRQRVIELDPYASQAVDNMFLANEVSDAAITLEHLDWNGQPVGMAPDWSTERAIGLESGVRDREAQPDWLKESFPGKTSSAPSAPAFASEQEASSSPAQPEDDIPDFLRAAGWGASTGAFDESKASAMFDDEPKPAAEPLAQGDLPDWVKAMAPKETPQPAEEQEEEMPDWINKIGTGALAIPSEESPSSDHPDWLSDLGEPSASQPSEEQPDWMKGFGEEQPVSQSSDEQPDWMNRFGEEQPAAHSSEEQPDWMKSFGEEQPATQPSEEQPDWMKGFGEDEQPVSKSEDQLDWLKDLESEEQPSGVTSFLNNLRDESEKPVSASQIPSSKVDTGSLGTSEEEQDDSFAWLENLAAKQGATEGLLTKPEERLEEEPDWIKQAKSLGKQAISQPSMEQQPVQQVPIEEQPLVEKPEPVAPASPPATKVEDLGKSGQEIDDALAWFESLAVKQGATEGLLTKPEERSDQEPEWIKQVKKSTGELQVAPAQQEPAEEQQPVEPVPQPSAKVEDLGKSGQEIDDALAWFESLAAKQGATEGLLTEPEERREQEPEWVKRAKSAGEQKPFEHPPMEETPVAEKEFVSEPEPVAVESTPEDDVSAWLRGLDEGEETEEPAPVAEDDTSSWLKSLDEPDESPITVDSGADDLPAWMHGIREEEVLETESTVPMDEAEFAPHYQSPVQEPVSEEVPGWLSGLEEEEQVSEVVPSDDLPAWMRDETGEVVAEPTKIEPTRSADWKPVEVEPEEPAQPEPVPAPVQEKPVQSFADVTEKLKSAPKPPPKGKKPAVKKQEVQPATPPEPYKEPVTRRGTGMVTMPVDPILGSARAELSRSNIPGALETYEKLIKKGRFLEEVIYDLREALYRYPVEVSIWQTLGDAYMRANQLQDALDAYTKAEELLR